MKGYQLATDPTHYCAVGRERSVSCMSDTHYSTGCEGGGGTVGGGNLTQNMYCGCYGGTEKIDLHKKVRAAF